MKPQSLYVLVDPTTEEDRYVGYSERPKDRYKDHLRDRQNCHRVHWIQMLLGRGICPRLRIIAILATVEDAKKLEVALIAKIRARGADLVNDTNGGEGLSGFKHSKETREHWSLTRSGVGNSMFGRCGEDNPQFGRKRSEETRERMRDAWELRRVRLGIPKKPLDSRTLREKRQDAAAARWKSSEEHEKQSLLAKRLNRGDFS